MLPYIEFWFLNIPTYGLISLVGVFLAGTICLKLSQSRNIDKYYLLRTGVVAAAGLFLGAHLLYGLTRIEDIVYAFNHYGNYDGFFDFIWEVFGFVDGMVFYGGLYGGLLAGVIYAKVKRLPLGDTTDVFAVFIPLFHAFGRVGCFFAGCCYGVRSDFGFSGRVYATGMREAVKRLPIQLIEAVGLLVLFSVLFVLFKKERIKGKLIFVYLLSYAVLRFVLEFFRGDEIRGHFLMFSTSQWISIVTFVWVSLYIIINAIREKKTE